MGYFCYVSLFLLIFFNVSKTLYLPCEDQEENDVLPPLLPRVFRAEMELVNFDDIDSNSFIMKLNYDGKNDRVSISLTVNGISRTIVMDYKEQHVIDFNVGNDECLIKSMEEDDFSAEIRVLFPLFNKTAKSERLFQPESLFGIDPLVFRGNFGQDKCRADTVFADNAIGIIDCQKWVFCHGQQNNPFTKNVAVYWSINDWKIPGSEKPVFLGYELFARDESDNTTINRKVFNVMYLSDDLDQSSFEVPEGLLCASNITSRAFPKLKTEDVVWEFQTEIVFNDRRKILNSHTWFNFINGLARTEFEKEDGEMITSIAEWEKKMVHVKSGVKCNVSELNLDNIGDINSDELEIIEFINYSLMFKDKGSANWLYIGKRYVRNILTDVWQTVMSDWPRISNRSTHSLWDWHFTFRKNSEDDEDVRPIPVYLKIRILDNDIPGFYENFVIEYHVYGFDFVPNSDTFDISDCYSSIAKRHLQFQLDVPDNVLTKNPQWFSNTDFLWKLKILIALTAEVSSLRVSLTRTVIEEGKLFVQFYLLDKPQLNAADTVPDLDLALKYFNESIQTGFMIPFKEMDIKSVPNTLSDVTKTCPVKKERRRRSDGSSEKNFASKTIRTSQIHPYDDVLGVSLGSILSGLAVGASGTLIIAIKKGLA